MTAQPYWVTRILLRGLSIIVPVAVSIAVIRWLMSSTEHMVMTLAVDVFPWNWYVPGMGLLLLFSLTFLVGLLMYPWASRQLDRLCRNIPVFSAVYGPVRDLMEIVGDGGRSGRGRPVVLTLPGTEVRTLAFLTRTASAEVPGQLIPEGHVAVYIQLASQLGGMCMIVPESACEPLDISTDGAMRFALTAGFSNIGASRKGQPVASKRPAHCNQDPLEFSRHRSLQPVEQQ